MPSGVAILSPAPMAYRADSMLAPLLFTQLLSLGIPGTSYAGSWIRPVL